MRPVSTSVPLWMGLALAGVMAWPQARASDTCQWHGLPSPWFWPAARWWTSPTGAARRETCRMPSSLCATGASPMWAAEGGLHPQGRAGHRLRRKVPHPRAGGRLCGHELAGPGQRQSLYGRDHRGGPQRLSRTAPSILPPIPAPTSTCSIRSAQPTTGACWPSGRSGLSSSGRARAPPS